MRHYPLNINSYAPGVVQALPTSTVGHNTVQLVLPASSTHAMSFLLDVPDELESHVCA